MLTRCYICSDRLTLCTSAFYLVANENFYIRTISAFLANARTIQIKIKIKPSFTQRVRACPKMPNHSAIPFCKHCFI